MNTTRRLNQTGAESLEHWRHRVQAAAQLGQMAFGGDSAIADEVGSISRHLAFLPPETIELDLADPAQCRIGDYELQAKLGQGGMGVVYRARQASLDREVALKLLLAGPWASADFIERFRREAQHAARLNHPNIVPIHEVGSHEQLNYFSMALVRGESLAARLGAGGPLPPLAAARLVRVIAEAVDYAHRLGVLHLDLKPGNILLDERGEPMVADFGLARRLDQSLTADSDEISGTPSYMAPEQAQLKAQKLSPATDIYGLGAVLYECLTGRPPFIGPNVDETLRRVVNDEVAPPHRMRNGVPLDLSAICCKCLAKAPDERYASARELAEDLGRFIEQRPVSVRVLNPFQRLWRWVGREPQLALAMAAVVLALVAGTAVSAWQARVARQRADELATVSRFSTDLLKEVDPTKAGQVLSRDVIAKFEQALTRTGTAPAVLVERTDAFARQWRQVNATDAARSLIDRTILAPAVERIDRQFKDQPVIDAELRQVLADRYVGMGLSAAAQPLQERALATRRRILGEDHPATLESKSRMGVLLTSIGKFDEAEPLLREATATRQRLLGVSHPDTLDSQFALGVLLVSRDRPADAEPVLRDVLARRRQVLGADHVDTLTVLAGLGMLLSQNLSKPAEAEPLVREALETSRRVRGADDPATLFMTVQLSRLLDAERKTDEAEALLRAAVDGSRRVLGDDHPDTVAAVFNLGVALASHGKTGEAEACYREALDRARRVLGEQDPLTMSMVRGIGALLLTQGKAAEAEPYYREALARSREEFRDGHFVTVNALRGVAGVLQMQGKLAEAEPFLREALATSQRVLGAQHFHTVATTAALGELLHAEHKDAEAEALLAAGEPNARLLLVGQQSFGLAQYLATLGASRAGLHRYAAAEANLLEAQGIVGPSAAPARQRRDGLQAIVDLYRAWDAAEPGRGHDGKALEWQRKLDQQSASP